MIRATFHPILICVLLGLAELEMFSKAENQTWTCEEGWIPFTAKGDIYCVITRPGEKVLSEAHLGCVKDGASLISIHSKEKDDFVFDLMKKLKYSTSSILLGLTNLDEAGYNHVELLWRRLGGTEKMDYSNFRSSSGPFFDGSVFCTWKLAGDGTWFSQPCTRYTEYPYFCEKRPQCAVGTFGRRCEKQCHCHGEPCDPSDLTGSCRFGCERGWMGIGCDKRKENADVTYYCVNSKDQGTYVSIMIDTKGVNYRNIHGLNAEGDPAPWCNDTALIIGRPKDFVDIQIFKTKANLEALNAGVCAGKVLDEDIYQWTLVIQERRGILMNNDQSLLITCNFSNAETLSRDGYEDVREVIETPIHSLDETHEDVKLEVVDAFNGQVLTQAKTGSPVRLQMSFGLRKGSLVRGVIPYSCVALSDDGKQRQPLLDKFGCPESDLVSSFQKSNNSHVIQTDWFAFFGFDGSSVVQLQCSFTFCFINCETGCDHLRKNASHEGHRVRRDIQSHSQEVHPSVIRRIEILPVAAGKADRHDLPTKPAFTVPNGNEKETKSESEASLLVQWASYNWMFVLFTIIIIAVILIIYIFSMWTVHSSIKSFRQEIKSALYQNELMRVNCSD